MSITDLLPEIRSLARADKFRVLQILLKELAEREEIRDLRDGAEYPIWTPYACDEAAKTLLGMIDYRFFGGSGIHEKSCANFSGS